MAFLFFICLPVAYALAALARASFLSVRADLSRCASCGYSLAGLTNVASCPECGDPPNLARDHPPRLSPRIYLLFVLISLLAPVAIATFHFSVLLFGVLTWAIAAAAMAGCVRIVDGSLPRGPTMALLVSLVLPALMGAGGTIAIATLYALGTLPPSEYGPGFDIGVDTVLSGPLLSLNAACWAFSITLIVVQVARARSRDGSR